MMHKLFNSIKHCLSFLSGDIADLRNTFIDTIYPIGSIYMSVNSVNPSTLFGGTWESWGSGRVPVGVNASDENFNSVEKTGGTNSNTISWDNLPTNVVMNFRKDVVNTVATGKEFTTRDTSFAANSDASNVWYFGANNDVRKNDISTTVTGATYNRALDNLQPYITCYMWKRTA